MTEIRTTDRRSFVASLLRMTERCVILSPFFSQSFRPLSFYCHSAPFLFYCHSEPPQGVKNLSTDEILRRFTPQDDKRGKGGLRMIKRKGGGWMTILSVILNGVKNLYFNDQNACFEF